MREQCDLSGSQVLYAPFNNSQNLSRPNGRQLTPTFLVDGLPFSGLTPKYQKLKGVKDPLRFRTISNSPLLTYSFRRSRKGEISGASSVLQLSTCNLTFAQNCSIMLRPPEIKEPSMWAFILDLRWKFHIAENGYPASYLRCPAYKDIIARYEAKVLPDTSTRLSSQSIFDCLRLCGETNQNFQFNSCITSPGVSDYFLVCNESTQRGELSRKLKNWWN